MFYIDFVYDYENLEVIIIPNQIIDLNLTDTHDL